MKRILKLSIVSIILSFSELPAGVPDLMLKTLHFNIYYSSGGESHASAAAEYAEAAYDELSSFFTVNIPYVTDIILYASYADFRVNRIVNVKNDPYTSAFSIPFHNLIVLPSYSDPVSAERNLRHEICHIFIFNYFGRNPLRNMMIPSELEEGICEYFSGSFDAYDSAVIRDSLRSSDSGRTQQYCGTVESEIADQYTGSSVMMRMIAGKNNKKEILNFLNDVMKGKDYNAAIRSYAGSNEEITQYKADISRYSSSDPLYPESSILESGQSVESFALSQNSFLIANENDKMISVSNNRDYSIIGGSFLYDEKVCGYVSISNTGSVICCPVIKNGKYYAKVVSIGKINYIDIPLVNPSLIRISGDGKKLYFSERSPRFSRIYGMDIESGKVYHVYFSDYFVRDYLVYNDSILYVSQLSAEGWSIRRIDTVSGKNIKNIANVCARDFSENSGILYFASDDDGTYQIYGIPLGGGTLMRYTDSASCAVQPFVCGGKLYFRSLRGFQHYIAETELKGRIYNPSVFIPVKGNVTDYKFNESGITGVSLGMRIFPSVFAYNTNSRFACGAVLSFQNIFNNISLDIESQYKRANDSTYSLSGLMNMNLSGDVFSTELGGARIRDYSFFDFRKRNMPFSNNLRDYDAVYINQKYFFSDYFNSGLSYFYQRKNTGVSYSTGMISLAYDNSKDVPLCEKNGIMIYSDYMYTYVSESDNFRNRKNHSIRAGLNVYYDLRPFSFFADAYAYRSPIKYKASKYEIITGDTSVLSAEIFQRYSLRLSYDLNETLWWSSMTDALCSISLFGSNYSWSASRKNIIYERIYEAGFGLKAEKNDIIFLYLDCGRRWKYRDGLGEAGLRFGALISI